MITNEQAENTSFQIFNGGAEPLIIIRPDGSVEADSIERASEAGRVFVEVVRERFGLEVQASVAAALAERDAQIAGLVEALRLTTQILQRYRTETPSGHSPHMIAFQADTALLGATAELAKHEGKQQ